MLAWYKETGLCWKGGENPGHMIWDVEIEWIAADIFGTLYGNDEILITECCYITVLRRNGQWFEA